MKYLFAISFLTGFAAGCIVINTNHCAYEDNPDRTVCKSGYSCTRCVVENNGCVPQDQIKDDKCRADPDPVDPMGSSSTGGPTTNDTTEGPIESTGPESTSSGSSEESGSGSSSTTGPVEPVCGNKLVEMDEECDDGNLSGGDGCENDCTISLPVCGNKLVEMGEECDDGNLFNEDPCLDTCKLATCGDGYVLEGVEECEDKDPNVPGNSCKECKKVHRKVFVTSAEFKGALGPKGAGVMGADEKCQAAAQNLANPETYKAWISDGGGSSPVNRFDTSFVGVLELLDGTPISLMGWTTLVNDDLDHAIDVDELGAPQKGVVVWTNASISGQPAGVENCQGWTVSDGTKGRAGSTDYSGTQWTDYYTQVCSSPAHLYCFEDRL